MSRIVPAGLASAIALAALVGACSKGGGTEPTSTPSTPGSPFSSAASAGEPSDLDFAQLSASFGRIGAGALQQALPAGSPSLIAPAQDSSFASASALLAPLGLGVPTNVTTVDLPFLCCGSSASSLNVRGTVGAPGSSSAVPVSLQFTTDGPLQWASSNGGTTWSLNFTSNILNLTGSLTASNGTVTPGQELRLDGMLEYVAAGQTRTAPVSLMLRYSDLASGTASATGTIGPLQISGTSLPAVPEAQRCSAPREGCGSNTSGQCPCTKFVVCPSYGIKCGPS